MKELIRFDEETQRTFLKEVSERDCHPRLTRLRAHAVAPPLSPIGRGGRGSPRMTLKSNNKSRNSICQEGKKGRATQGWGSSSNKEHSGRGCGRSPPGGEGPLSLALSVASGGAVEGEGDVCTACLFPAR